MESVIPSLIKEVPNSAALIFVVWIFLKHIQEQQRIVLNIMERTEATLRYTNEINGKLLRAIDGFNIRPLWQNREHGEELDATKP